MQTRYLEVETIILEGDDAVIAANAMIEGFLYGEPVYANIYCSRDKLLTMINATGPGTSDKILPLLLDAAKSEGKPIQIDLHDYNDNAPWKPGLTLTLEPVEVPEAGFACYDLVDFESKPMNI